MAYTLFIDGRPVTRTGNPAPGPSTKTALTAKVVSFFAPDRDVFLLFHVANYNFPHGGIWKSIEIGNPIVITRRRERGIFYSSMIAGSLFIIGIYHFILFSLRRKDRAPLFFGLLCLVSGVRESLNLESLFYLIFPDSTWLQTIPALHFCYSAGFICLILYLSCLFPTIVSRTGRNLVAGYGLFNVLVAVFLDSANYTTFNPASYVIVALQFAYFLWIAVRAIRLKVEGAWWYLTGLLILMMAGFHDMFVGAGIHRTYHLVSFAILLFTLCQATLLAIRFSRAFAQSEALTAELQTANLTIEEMTIKKQEAERRREVDEMKSRFFSNLTHEFRTPLTLIISPAEHILRITGNGGPVEPAYLRRTFNTIQQNARRLLHLINQLLDLSKLEAGSMKVTESKGDLSYFIGELVNHFRLAAESKHIELVYRTESVPEQLLFDDEKIEKIAYNLISNALKYTPDGGWIEIGLCSVSSRPDGQLTMRLTVADSGIGIPADKLSSIFNRFYQVNDARARSVEGTGIGLALVRELTDLLQGRLWAESEIDRGTTISVEWPVRTPGENASSFLPYPLHQTYLPEVASVRTEATGPSVPFDNHRPLVLIVEDNEDLRELIACSLEGKYNLLKAANGKEGWEICRRELPELVISDVTMPVMDGIELGKLIKETHATNHIAVIYLTARTAPESKLEGLSTGANDYLTKPFDQQELQQRVANLLHHQEVLRDFYRRQFLESRSQQKAESPKNPFIGELQKMVESQLDNSELSVESLADMVSMSPRTLNRKLSALVGMTVSEFIRTYRLHKAADLLKSGHTVSETAYMIGFESPSYFGQCFKELFDTTPSDYIRGSLSEN
ncbi:ATP-binding protein [Larkinella soli]|uniref:ATP-binding protein n=1 Tax=Larkinella soli TaxID=1770527 RepID=UPI0013E31D5B|nr:ATP-binding protein [Larkinella soli]